MIPVVILDACVLYPAAQRDLFMWLAAGGAIRAHWTNQIHDEWMRNKFRNLPKTTHECADTLFAQGLRTFSDLMKKRL